VPATEAAGHEGRGAQPVRGSAAGSPGKARSMWTTHAPEIDRRRDTEITIPGPLRCISAPATLP